DASKIALVHLVGRLKAANYHLLDAQFHNPHLEQFGLLRLTRNDFKARLETALKLSADFHAPNVPQSGAETVQLITQTS
ncbi:MAG: leucyl/phenylalanyl-tRNA--protein transferase, partial [Pseudomonadota bacterium]